MGIVEWIIVWLALGVVESMFVAAYAQRQRMRLRADRERFGREAREIEDEIQRGARRPKRGDQ